MPFTLEAFKARRPFLYHFTAAENVERLKSTRELTSATKLARGVTDLSDKRDKAIAVVANGEAAWLQTQKPLHKANIAFTGGWQMSDFLNCLNSQVFFWPGTKHGPTKYGDRHFARNQWPSHPVALRLDISSVSEALLFCPYNSGAPRFAHGKASPRGPDTFLTAQEFRGALSDVIEVVVKVRVSLPPSTEISDSLNGPWHKLFA